MTQRADSRHSTSRIDADHVASGFRYGTHALDDYFARHALTNSQTGVGRCYVLRRSDEESDLPRVLGFFTLSMALVSSEQAARTLAKKLPKYPMSVALVGRLAIDERARGRRLGEALLMDALARVVDAADVIGLEITRIDKCRP